MYDYPAQLPRAPTHRASISCFMALASRSLERAAVSTAASVMQPAAAAAAPATPVSTLNAAGRAAGAPKLPGKAWVSACVEAMVGGQAEEGQSSLTSSGDRR